MQHIARMIDRCNIILTNNKSCSGCVYWEKDTPEGQCGCFVINYLNRVDRLFDNRPSTWLINDMGYLRAMYSNNNNIWRGNNNTWRSSIRCDEINAPEEYVKAVKKCIIIAHIELGVKM